MDGVATANLTAEAEPTALRHNQARARQFSTPVIG